MRAVLFDYSLLKQRLKGVYWFGIKVIKVPILEAKIFLLVGKIEIVVWQAAGVKVVSARFRNVLFLRNGVFHLILLQSVKPSPTAVIVERERSDAPEILNAFRKFISGG